LFLLVGGFDGDIGDVDFVFGWVLVDCVVGCVDDVDVVVVLVVVRLFVFVVVVLGEGAEVVYGMVDK